LANGNDRRQVEPERRLQQVSRETTFAQDEGDRTQLEATLHGLAEAVARGLREHGVQGRTVTVKVRYHDFRAAARQATLPEATDRLDTLVEQGKRLLGALLAAQPQARLRLLGIGMSNFGPEEGRQLPLPLQMGD
jgi:DNA polymerase-4